MRKNNAIGKTKSRNRIKYRGIEFKEALKKSIRQYDKLYKMLAAEDHSPEKPNLL